MKMCFKCKKKERYKKQTYCYECFYEKFGAYQKAKYLKKRELEKFIKVQSIPLEVWRGVDEYYMVSNFGRVKSVCRKDKWGNLHYGEKLLKATIDSHGYRQVKLYNPATGKKSSKSVHVLVAVAFVKNQKRKTDVHHKDSDTLNNVPANLKWVTKSEHSKITHKEGRVPYHKGESHPISKLKENDVRKIRKLYNGGYKVSSLAYRFDVSRVNISRIIERKIWKHVQ